MLVSAGRGVTIALHPLASYRPPARALQARMSWAPLFLSMLKVSVKLTPMALQASGILTRLRAPGAEISWVTTVQL